MDREDSVTMALVEKCSDFFEQTGYGQANHELEPQGEHFREELKARVASVEQQQIRLSQILVKESGHVALAGIEGAIDDIERNLGQYIIKGTREHLRKRGARRNPEKRFQLLGVGHDLLCPIHSEDPESTPGCLPDLGSHLLGLGDSFTEKPAEQLQWEFLSCTAERGLVRWAVIGAFFVSQTGVTIESVDHLLVSEPLAGTNHVDDKGNDDRKR
jgi:hypothetical protein